MFLQIVILVCFQRCINAVPVDDPSKWPGHLEPFGSKQNTIQVEELYYWPSAADFFKTYVDKSQPVLFKGVYKHSKARYWDDNYLRGSDDDEDVDVFIEKSLKENRTNRGGAMSMKEFIATYREKPLLMFSTVPNRLMHDVLLPPPLICNETSKHLVNVNAVISRGGSKSMVHNEDVETIYCSIQGVVETLLIEYTKNKNYVIDRPEGGYSTMDVDSVDYTKYPNLRNVDQYVKATINEGDCLYLPFRWYKQQSSYANSAGRSIALNVWFSHLHNHYPQDCTINQNEATLDRFEYSDLKEQNMGESGRKKERENDGKFGDLLDHFYQYVLLLKRNNVSFHVFYRLLKADEALTHQNHKDLEFPKSFKMLAFQLFRKLDRNNDTVLSHIDFQMDDQEQQKLEAYLEYQTARIEDYVEDLVESKHHDEPLHDFDRRMIEKIRSQRPFDEL